MLSVQLELAYVAYSVFSAYFPYSEFSAYSLGADPVLSGLVYCVTGP